MIRLYVNVDHVATLRQQRGTRYPDPVAAATLCELAGADGRVVVRYSGTEPKARVMIEGTDEAGIRARADEIASALQRELAR